MENPLGSLQQKLSRKLSAIETYGFGLAGPPGWIGLVIPIHLALGESAIWVWLPAALVGVLINYQVKHLGKHMLEVAGGTPNYIARLLKPHSSILAVYAGAGYALNWISAITMNAILLSDLIQSNLVPLKIDCPIVPMRIGFVLLPFIVAFSGTRALSILHLFFVIPTIGLFLLFGLQGLVWLTFDPSSPGFFPNHFEPLGFADWAKWFFFATYATYSSETASSFVAESQQPLKTLRFLDIVAWLGLFIFLADSWVVARLSTSAALEDPLLILVSATRPFWGQIAPLIVTFLMASLCLLISATAVSNCPRIFYQLAQDNLIAPVLGVVSSRGVFGPGLFLTLISSLIFLLWGDVDQIIVIGNVGWFITFVLLHWVLWTQRTKSESLLPHLTLGILIAEVAIFVGAGSVWGWTNFLTGLLAPLSLVLLNQVVQQLRFAPLHPAWWQKLNQADSQWILKDPLMFQVIILILLLMGAVLGGWEVRSLLDQNLGNQDNNLIPILLLVVVFIGVAIACWTSLPQMVATLEASELAKQEEQAKLVDILEATSDFVITASADLHVQYVNHAARQLFGFSPTEAISNFHFSNTCPAWAFTHLQEHGIPTALREGVWVGETALLSQTNQEIPVSQLIIAHKFGSSEVNLISSIARDITEQKRNEAILHESNRRWQSLLNEVQLLVLQQDPKGTIEYVNPYLLKTMGYIKQDLVGKKVFDILPHRYGRNHEKDISQYWASQDTPQQYQNVVLTQLGEERIINWNITPLRNIQGDLVGHLCIGQDITEQSKMEQIKAEFISIVSHELRTPLTSINGALELLALGLLSSESDRGQQAIEIASKEAERLTRLVNDILDLDRLESGKLRLELKPCNLADLMLYAGEFMQLAATEANIRLEIEPLQLPLVVDSDRITQVLTNLLSNAIKFSPSGSAIWLTASFVQSADRTQSQEPTSLTTFVQLTVRDQGRGIPTDKLASIFERFHQVDASDSRKKGGTGLGLAICRSIVQQHGGTIWVESTLDQGSQFHFTLPLSS